MDISNWNHIHSLNLADPHFNIPSNIDILLAVDIVSQIISNGRVPSGCTDIPDAFNTAFGYIIIGKFLQQNTHSPQLSLFCESDDSDLNQILNKFWEVE